MLIVIFWTGDDTIQYKNYENLNCHTKQKKNLKYYDILYHGIQNDNLSNGSEMIFKKSTFPSIEKKRLDFFVNENAMTPFCVMKECVEGDNRCSWGGRNKLPFYST